jgi:CHAT domain-containing protein/tetratricopeptide (TPR) repeat protein
MSSKLSRTTNQTYMNLRTLTWLCLSVGIWFAVTSEASAQASRRKLASEANAANNKAGALIEKGHYAEALPLFQRYLEIVEKIDSNNSRNLASALNNVAYVLLRLGKSDEAIPLYERALRIEGKSKAIGKAEDLYVLSGLGAAYVQSKKLNDALEVNQTVLHICEKKFGKNHQETARALVNLAAVQKQLDNLASARASCEQALLIAQGLGADESAFEAYALVELASVAAAQEDWVRAVDASQKALEINTKVLGPSHPDLAISLTQVGQIYIRSGDYAAAIPFFERSLAIKEKNADNPLDLSIRLKDLGRAYAKTADYPKAIALYKRASEKLSEQPDTRSQLARSGALNDLGLIYESLGDHSTALELFRESLSILEPVTEENDEARGAPTLNISRALKQGGVYDEAIVFAEKAQLIAERNNDTYSLPYCLSNTAELILLKDKKLEESEAKMLKAVELFEQQRGGKVDAAVTLNDWGELSMEAGSHKNVRTFLEKALHILEAELGPQHPFTADALGNLARDAYAEGDVANARAYATRSVSAKDRQLQTVLKLDEGARLTWQQANARMGAEAIVLRPEQLAGVQLRWKGAVLDSVFEDQALAKSAAADDQGLKDLEAIRKLRRQMSQLASASGERSDEERDRLEDELAGAQQRLAERFSLGGRVRRNADLTVDVIVPQLSKGWVLVDFLVFSDPKLEKNEREQYGALVTSSGGTADLVRLGSRKQIDLEIKRLRDAITAGEEESMQSAAQKIYSEIWEPLTPHLPAEAKGVIISPESDLNFLPFVGLIDSRGVFLGESYAIAYIGSGRDLARKPSGESAKSLVVFADPVFDASGEASSAKEMVALRSAEADVFGTINLPPLPGTKAEAEQLEVIAAGAGWDIKAITGEEATESSVREAKKPGVLHLATHGFYLNSYSPPAEEGTRGMSVVGLNTQEDKKRNENGVDPMRASGVALTGAQQTLKLWSQRQAPDPETDGILTAEEVASLDLNGTWLVTLSACETGVGEARSGEGVFGLRRAFMMAGAENLLMTLWPVADDATASIMADFYKEALATGDAPGSLAKVQRDWLVKLRKEKGLAAAIREAGPFAMVMMTAPTHPPVELPASSSGKSSWWPF